MEKGLIIVESPTKERVLRGMVGNEFNIISSKGHIKDLPKSRMGIDIKNNFRPTWITIPGRRQVLKNIKSDAQGKSIILLATDPDREGEAISWHIAQELHIKNQKCRIVFNEITKDVVLQSIKNPRELNVNTVNSQITRRLLDRLVGYGVSPLSHKYTGGRSAGRVQSVAMRLIAKKEKEIEGFSPEEFWKINTLLLKEKDKKTNAFQAALILKKGKKIKIKNAEEAKIACREIEDSQFVVSKISINEVYQHSPLPLKTSTLQQMAFQKLNFSVKKTMRVAQQLYEGISISGIGTQGLITYMRTDSTRLSNEAKIKAREYILRNYGQEYLALGKNVSLKSKKKETIKIQDAHEAIRATSIQFEPESIKNDLTNDQYKLYQMIWKYYIASQMKAALLEKEKIRIEAKHYTFETNGTKILFPGFLKIMGDDEARKVAIPELTEGEKLTLLKIESTQSFTKPPARYNEASLVKILEKEGIGRPSTYAAIIDKIISRGYVEKENKKLKPTKLGLTVDQFLVEYFSDIINVKFTAKMENELDKIESGAQNWQDVLSKFYEALSQNIERLKEKPPEGLLEKTIELTEEKCALCGSLMEVRNGPYGKYLACSRFLLKHPTRPFLIKIQVPCPEDGCTGEIVKLKSKKGRIFYGCSRYPDCKFSSNHQPIDKRCPECNSILVKTINRKKEVIYECHNKKCQYKEKA